MGMLEQKVSVYNRTFVIWKGSFSQIILSHSDIAFSEFMSANEQVLRKHNFYLLCFTLQSLSTSLPREDVNKMLKLIT